MKQPPYQVRNMLFHFQKYLKPKKYLKRAKKLHQNQLLIRMPQSVLYWLKKQQPHQVRNMLLHLQKYLKPKKYPKKGQKAASKLVARKRVIPQKASVLCDGGAMASNSDLDGEDYYIVKDDNENASSEYVPCINYQNDKVYPEDEKIGWVRLEEDTGPPDIYRFEGSCRNYMNLNKYTLGAVFDEFFEDRMWTILSENTNKYVHTKLTQAKDNGDKDPIELLSEGVNQNPCA